MRVWKPNWDYAANPATTDQFILERLNMIKSKLNSEDAAEQSLLLLSSMVGALVLSRSVNDPRLPEHLLNTTRKRLIEHVETPQGACRGYPE